jgi:hypothetical protein
VEPVEPLHDLVPVRHRTPPAIHFALLLFVFAIASPFIGSLAPGGSNGDGWHTIGVLFQWVLAGAAAALLGIVCTVIGAWRGPRSGTTALAILLASLFGLGFLLFLASILS